MKKNIILLFVVFVVFASCKTKSFQESKTVSFEQKKEVNYIPYYLKVYEADSLYLINNFDKAYKILDSLFKIYEPRNSDNFAEYSVYLNSAVKCRHIECIREKAIFGLKNFGNIQSLHKEGYAMYKELKKVASISNQDEQELKDKYYNSLNKELRYKIQEIYLRDQEVRRDFEDDKKRDSIDNINLIELVKIFEETGFPEKKIIGSNNAYDMPDKWFVKLEILFMHQSSITREKYIPVFFNALKRGLCEPEVYASIYDKNEIENGRKQKYGTFSYSGGAFDTIMEQNSLKIIRKNIGLPSINYYKWRVKQLESEN